MATPILAKRGSGSTRSTRRCAPAASERGLFLLKKLEEQAQHLGIIAHVQPYSAYRNTIPLEEQAPYPGDLDARGAHHGDHALERAGDGGAREPGVWRARRPHRELCLGRGPLRGRLQPFLPRRRRDARRRPRVLPAAFGARRLCARVPRRAASARSSSRNYRQEVGGNGPVARIRIRG